MAKKIRGLSALYRYETDMEALVAHYGGELANAKQWLREVRRAIKKAEGDNET